MKTPTEGLKCLGRKEISYLIYVVLFCPPQYTLLTTETDTRDLLALGNAGPISFVIIL
jgi:hypothetical protein